MAIKNLKPRFIKVSIKVYYCIMSYICIRKYRLHSNEHITQYDNNNMRIVYHEYR